jgi:(1->4)-alpha-D-glucan 1-alpha-D-glucosylmutase
LQLRRAFVEVFAQGDYEPLSVGGAHKEHVLAFSRSYEQTTIVVVLAKWMARLSNGEQVLPIGGVWGDTFVTLSREPKEKLQEFLTGATVGSEAGASLKVADVLRSLPIAVMVG